MVFVFGSDFNYDFHVTADEAVAPIEYNYRDTAALEQAGMTYLLSGQNPGLSVFLRTDDGVFHTYSTYARGLDLLLNTYNYLDLTPLGRQDEQGGHPVQLPRRTGAATGAPALGLSSRHSDSAVGTLLVFAVAGRAGLRLVVASRRL